jgi:flagellar export protein FliJ
MTRFRFRLQTVLDWRRKQFDQAVAHQNRMKAERSEVEELLRQNTAGMALQVHAQMAGFELAQYQAYLERLQRERRALQERLRNLDGQLRQQAAVVIQANQNVKTVERLREKRLEEWQIASDKELEGLVSDLVANRWGKPDS